MALAAAMVPFAIGQKDNPGKNADKIAPSLPKEAFAKPKKERKRRTYDRDRRTEVRTTASALANSYAQHNHSIVRRSDNHCHERLVKELPACPACRGTT